MKCLFSGPLLLAAACGSGPKGGASRGSDDGAPTDDTAGTGAPVTDTTTAVGDTALDGTGSGGGDDSGDTSAGSESYTVVPLDDGAYTTLTPSIDMDGGWSLGDTLALTSDLWGDGRPEVVSTGYFNDYYGYVVSTTYIFDSDFFSTGPKAGVAQDEARIQIETENGGGTTWPSVIGDIDGDGLDELALRTDGLGASDILIRGDHLASLSGVIEREDLDLDADVTFSACNSTGYIAWVWQSGHLSDPSREHPDLVAECFGTIVVAHGADIEDGSVELAQEGQVRIYNTDTWGGDPVVVDDRLFWPTVLGDLDGDGLDELAIPMSSRHETYNYIFYGNSLDFENPTSVLDADITFHTPDALSWGSDWAFSFQPTPLSDVDGDGVADVLWGSGTAEVDDRANLGIAWFWSGVRLASPMIGDIGDADVTFTADLEYSFVGNSAADVGDLDGDSLSDLLIHSRGHFPVDDSVLPFVHLVRGADMLGGGTYNLDEAGIAFLPDDDGYGNSGMDLGEYAGGQDLDGDGVGDILIGNGDWKGYAPNDLGRIWMIPGGSLPL